MIHFQTIRAKNFMGIGNNWHTFDVSNDGTKIIIGGNGSGKTTLLDILCYTLYNKPFRKVSLPKLVNTINKKNMLVEVTFNANGHDYLVRRGQKPKVFDIIKDGTPLDTHGNAKDSQAELESIIGMGFQAFTQIVILGSGKYTPFMDLSTPERRAIVEDILGIGILTDMARIAKEDLSLESKIYRTLDTESDRMDVRIEMLSRQIKEGDQDRESEIVAANEIIKNKTSEYTKYKESIDSQREVQDSIKGDSPHDINSKISQGKMLLQKTTSEIENINKEVRKYQESVNCPSCDQDIPDGYFDEQIGALQLQLPNKEALCVKLTDAITSLNEKLEAANERQQRIDEIRNSINADNTQMVLAEQTISSQKQLVEKLSKPFNPAVTDELQNIIAEQSRVKEKMDASDIKIEDLNESIDILSDKGVKAAIIADYIPLINDKVNENLMIMGLPFSLSLDEAFKETILARNDDSLSYNSFSEGEKARLDLSLLFTWREVARQRNSVSTNLLIMDEVFDGSLDTQGSEEVAEIIKGVGEDAHVIVISHNTENLLDKFDKVVMVRKVAGFTEIEDIVV